MNARPIRQHTLHNVRVAVIQLECHPSFIIGGRDHSAEPYFAETGTRAVLARLRDHGFPVSDLQEICKTEYQLWHLHRLWSVLEWLESLADPYWGARIPDVLTFSEGSIPPEFLPALAAFARKHKCAIFAGTHALITVQDGDRLYQDLTFWHDTFDGLRERCEQLEQTRQSTLASLAHLREDRDKLVEQQHIWKSVFAAMSRTMGDHSDKGSEDGSASASVRPHTFAQWHQLLAQQMIATEHSLATIETEVAHLEQLAANQSQKCAKHRAWLATALSIRDVDHDMSGSITLPFHIQHAVRKEVFSEWRLEATNQKDTVSVLPVIRPTGHIHFRIKEALSPHEFTGQVAESSPRFPLISTVSLNLRNSAIPITIAPYVCAEALRVHRLDTEHVDLAVVVSFNKDFAWFDPIVQHTSSNRIPVVYANDGRFGDSGVIFIHEKRSGDQWWFGPTNRGRLPPGDSILVMDVTCGAAFDGGANPGQHYAIIALSAVVPRNPDDVSFLIADMLGRAANEARTQGFCSESTSRALFRLSERPGATRLQSRKLERLKALIDRQAATPPMWRIHGHDCVFGMTHSPIAR